MRELLLSADVRNGLSLAILRAVLCDLPWEASRDVPWGTPWDSPYVFACAGRARAMASGLRRLRPSRKETQ